MPNLFGLVYHKTKADPPSSSQVQFPIFSVGILLEYRQNFSTIKKLRIDSYIFWRGGGGVVEMGGLELDFHIGLYIKKI
jgi:hypothetical protein